MTIGEVSVLLEHRIDAFGEMCPIPIIRAEIKLKQINHGEVVVLLTDHSCSSSSVANHFITKYKYPCHVRQVDDGIWEIKIEKAS